MIYTPEMMRTLARQHDEDSDTRAALMQAADDIERWRDLATDRLKRLRECVSEIEKGK